MSTASIMQRVLDELGDSAEFNGGMSIELLHRLATIDDNAGSLGISEASEQLGLSAHTLRYYERIGLLEVERDRSGHRVYGPSAQRRLIFITRMRLSGMPMRDLQHYVELADQGRTTEPERLDLLVEHRDTIREKIRQLQLSLAATEFKIATYGGKTGPEL